MTKLSTLFAACAVLAAAIGATVAPADAMPQHQTMRMSQQRQMMMMHKPMMRHRMRMMHHRMMHHHM